MPSLEPDADGRVIEARVAGVAALFVAKAYKITQRVDEPGQSRLTNKDAGDVLRLMMATAPEDVACLGMGLVSVGARNVNQLVHQEMWDLVDYVRGEHFERLLR